jgi:hypothetical protein
MFHVQALNHEAVDFIDVSSDLMTHKMFTFDGWQPSKPSNGTLFHRLKVTIVTSRSQAYKSIGQEDGSITLHGTLAAQEQSAFKTRTNQSESEEPPEDVWEINIDPVEIDIPQRNGRVETQSVEATGAIDLTGAEVPIELFSVVEMAAVGVWDGVGVGTFEGTAIGPIEMAGDGQMIGGGDASMTLPSHDDQIVLEPVTAVTEQVHGEAKWRPNQRLSFASDWNTKHDGNTHNATGYILRKNTPIVLWAFLCKAPEYLYEQLQPIEPYEGSGDVPRLQGGQWVMKAERFLVGQRTTLSIRDVSITTNEKMWLQVTTARNNRDDINTWAQDFVEVVVGVAQEVAFL